MNDAIRIPLRGADGSVRDWALVDAEDFESLAEHRWRISNWGYAVRSVPQSRRRAEPSVVLMHRQIMGLQGGDRREVEHRNRDKLDNRRANLRVLTRKHGQNLTPRTDGTSRHRGVCWNTQRGQWMAYVHLRGRCHHFGFFDDEDEAAAAAVAGRAELMPFAVD